MTTQTRAFSNRRDYQTGNTITRTEWAVTVRTPGEPDITRVFATQEEADAEVKSIRSLLWQIDFS